MQQTLLDLGDEILGNALTCPPGQFDRIWDEGMRRWLAAGAQTVIDERAAKFIAP